ncbi:MAG: protein kinase domain-containing protein [Planctomycetaceae bacterium]
MSSESNVSDKSNKPGSSGKSPGSEFVNNKLGKYRIEKKIGAGGMGAVFLAVDVELNRTVALKILPREKAQNPTLVKRFKSEGQAAAVLRHQNIVTVYEAGEADGYLYLALEYVEGTDVHNLVAKRGVLPVKRSIEIIRQLCRALQHAYEQNIVHRDLKPSNFLIKRDGTVKLTDMGLARSIDETVETNITRAGTTVGTVDYMSPEQARDSKAADIRSDIYSLGCSWHHMLTGDPPFHEGSLTNKLAAHATKAPPDPREKNPLVPEGVVAVIRKMLAKNPKDRYQTPQELLNDLDNTNLTRESISNNVLAALADADGEPQPVKKRAATASSIELPPKMESVPLLSEAKSINISALKISGILVIVLSVVGLFWWLTQGLSSSFDMGNTSGNHPYLNPDEGSQGAGSQNDTGSSQEGGANSQVANVNLPNAPLPGALESTPGSPPRPGTNPVAGNLPSAPTSAHSKTAPLTNREGETHYLPEWSQSNAMLEHYPIAPQLTPQANPKPSAGKPGPGSNDPGKGIASGPRPGSATLPASGGSRPPNSGSKSAPGVPINLPTAPPQSTFTPRPRADVTLSARPPRIGTPAPGVSGVPLPVNGSGASPTDSGTSSQVTEAAFSLPDILKQLTEKGGTIDLKGSGPFLLPPTEVQKKKRLVLRAAEGFKPIVVFQPNHTGETTVDSLLRISDGSLHLIGINFVMIGEQFENAEPLSMIEVRGGDLAVHDCSFTLFGKRSGTTAAFHLSGVGHWEDRQPKHQSRTFFNRVWIRGNSLTGIVIDQPAVDLIVNNSLFALGSAAAISFQQSAPATDATTGAAPTSTSPVPPAQRICRVVSSTLVCSPAWDLQPGTAKLFPATQIATANSIIATQRRDNHAAMFRSSAPIEPLNDDTKSSTEWIDWISEGTVFCGWSNLIEIGGENGPSPKHLKDEQDWNSFWKTPIKGQPFQTEPWPAEAIDDFGQSTPFDFEPTGVSTHSPSATSAIVPGCFVEQLISPDAHQFARAVAWAKKPAIPVDHFDYSSANEIAVNLNENDLGKWISEQTLPETIVIRATGSGRCKSSSVQITGKSVSIIFEHDEHDPLTLIPQMPKSAPGVQSTPLEAFLNVTDGKLKLQNARIIIDNMLDRRPTPIPSWMLHVERGSFELDGCICRGPQAPPKNWKGLIDWTGRAPERQDAPTSAAVFNDTLLYSPGTLLRMELNGQIWRGRNSAFISTGTIAQFILLNAQTSNVVDLQRCTLASTNRYFFISTSEAHQTSEPRLHFFTEECALAPFSNTRADENSPQILLTTPRDLAKEQLDWWEYSNAYSDSIQFFRVQENDLPGTAQKFSTDWEQFWGSARIQRPLTGQNVVVLRGHSKQPAQAAATIDDFNLDLRTKAGSWSEFGGPIGAHIQSGDEAGPSTTRPKTTPKNPAPDKPGTKPKSKFDF